MSRIAHGVMALKPCMFPPLLDEEPWLRKAPTFHHLLQPSQVSLQFTKQSMQSKLMESTGQSEPCT